MLKKDLVSLDTLTADDLARIFDLTKKIKAEPKEYSQVLGGQVLALVFQKSSTRTRVSFEAGMFQLGGTGMFLSGSDLQLGRGETIADTARVLSRYVDGIMARVFAHKDIEDLAEHATVPVINGLSDWAHPCQALADFFTVEEHLGELKGKKVAYVGDANNVYRSLVFGGVKLGVHVSMSAPEGYRPDGKFLGMVKADQERTGSVIEVHADPKKAVSGADVVYTDVWASMGQEAERKKRLEAFKNYQVNGELMKAAGPQARFMHCLPAHRGEEVTDEVADSPQSIIFDQAENRMHTQKALLVLLMGKNR